MLQIPSQLDQFLILKGVFSLELSQESIKEERIEIEPTSIYTPIPKRFTGVESWPTYSNLKCWVCDRIPRTYPKFLPLNPEKVNGRNHCDAHGHMCEWNCVIRYIEEKYPREQQSDLKGFVYLFESEFSGRRREIILPSPEKTQMKAYSGHAGITPAEWQKKLDELNSNYDLTYYKIEQFSVNNFVS